MITDSQVKLLRHKRMEGKTQIAAAAAVGICADTARRWEKGLLPSETKKPRTWRTRPDDFETVWESLVVPLLKADEEGCLEAKTILEHLETVCPGEFRWTQLRTLQRRLRDWKALHGPEKEVIFPQEHVPGREAALDFTDGTKLGVTICGQLLVHLLFLFKLSFSGWTWICVAFGETFEALVSGLQGALWDLGGNTRIIRHDNLSAATHELKKGGGRSLTKRFKDILDHYGMDSTRINPGKSHENGVAEKGNDLLKKGIRQALVLRGSNDFRSIEEYERFVKEVVERTRNRRVGEKLDLDREHLLPLPSAPVPNYTTYHPKVRRWSTFRVGGRRYSVPSRLIGHKVEIRQHPNVVEVYYRGVLVGSMPRLRGDEDVLIDYRHIIWSLVRKPGAFARYRFREALFPTMTFRRAYDRLCQWRGERADVEYVRVLHLAASTMEGPVERALDQLLHKGEAFDYAAVKAIANPIQATIPAISIPAPNLSNYDHLIGGAA